MLKTILGRGMGDRLAVRAFAPAVISTSLATVVLLPFALFAAKQRQCSCSVHVNLLSR